MSDTTGRMGLSVARGTDFCPVAWAVRSHLQFGNILFSHLFIIDHLFSNLGIFCPHFKRLCLCYFSRNDEICDNTNKLNKNDSAKAVNGSSAVMTNTRLIWVIEVTGLLAESCVESLIRIN